MPPVTAQEYRQLMAHHAETVTVITTRTPLGQLAGLTATAFCSLSVDPPTVLFCLGKNGSSAPAFEAASGFAVSLLEASQAEMSNLFAQRGGAKFEEMTLEESPGGYPLVPGAVGQMECEKLQWMDGGDHWIVTGRVVFAQQGGGQPLVYHQSGYTSVKD